MAQAAVHKEVEGRILDRHLATRDEPLMVSPIGGSALPAIAVKVTQRSLLALAKQPDVIAIMPNQRIHLIQPTAVPMPSRRATSRARVQPGVWTI